MTDSFLSCNGIAEIMGQTRLSLRKFGRNFEKKTIYSIFTLESAGNVEKTVKKAGNYGISD